MRHRIVVVGAGYAGLTVAGRLARRVDRQDVEITLVTPVNHFVERVRMHQLATGGQLAVKQLPDLLAGTGVIVRLGTVTEIRADEDALTLADGTRLDYDTLVHTAGSTDAQRLPGEADHAFHIASEPAALRLRDRLRRHRPDDGPVVVVGGGMTGIELATEIAESRPELRVVMVAGGEVGGWLSPKARDYLAGALDRLGIRTVERVQVVRIGGDRVELADGEHVASGLTVCTTGFAVHPLAAASTLHTTDAGQIVVDRSFRSVSHPNVYAAGDTAFALGPNDKPLRMSCASGVPGAWQAADAIAARLTGRAVPHTLLRYFQQNISLGRRDGIVQFVTADDTVKPRVLTGRAAVRYKEFVCRAALWSMGHPIPYPVRSRQVVTTSRATVAR